MLGGTEQNLPQNACTLQHTTPPIRAGRSDYEDTRVRQGPESSPSHSLSQFSENNQIRYACSTPAYST